MNLENLGYWIMIVWGKPESLIETVKQFARYAKRSYPPLAFIAEWRKR
jgi:hypothetical protein